MKKLPDIAKRVLAVDDDLNYLEITKRYISRMNLDVTIAKNGDEAIRLYREISPHVIMLDLVLPDKNGFEVLREIRASESLDDYTPIIVVTSKFGPDDFVDVFELGADDYILKPYRRYELEARLRSAIRLKDYHIMLKEKKGDLERLLTMKDEFLSMVTHDIKNYILSISLGCAAMCNEKAKLTEDDYKKFSRIIERKAKLMDEIVSNLLTSTKYELGQLVLNKNCVDLKSHLYDFHNGYKILNTDLTHDFCIEINEELGKVLIDEAKIDEVLTNLVTNGRKYGRENGRIILGASTFNADYFVVSVYDTGIGIPASELDSVFDKFKQLDKKRGGSGLGLAICSDIIKAHNGTIWAESKEGEWTKISFTIKKLEL